MAQIAALILLVLGLLPFANWIPGGFDAPWYAARLHDWIQGTALAAGVGVLTVIAIRSRPSLWPAGRWRRIGARWRQSGWRGDLVIAAVVLIIAAVVARKIFAAHPLMIDEVTQLYQARMLASGHLFLPAPAHPEFTSTVQIVDCCGKVYAQFPPGGPAMLAVGTLLHAEWLVGPCAAALGILCFIRLVRRLPLEDGTAFAAVLLAAFAPFALYLDGTMMNEVTTTAWLLAAALGLTIAVGDGRAHRVAALCTGLALGIAATIRPADAAAFAIPTAAWLCWRARKGHDHLGALLLSGVGVALPLLVLLWVNVRENGHPFQFGYVTMWGAAHQLGFHAAPWGEPHTPARGLELINLYLLELQDYLFESAAPALLFAAGALLLARRLRAFDRWVLVSCGCLLAAYFAYWHNGFYLGPRFMLPLVPWLALWSARLPAMLSERGVPVLTVRGVVAAGIAALAIGAVTALPIRAEEYRGSMASRRFDVDSAARANGVRDAVVLVREWWGAQLVARMWALGASRPEAEHLYRWNDACRLETAITATEEDGSRDAGLERRLEAFRGDSARLLMNRTIDTTVRVAPGAVWTPRCIRRLREDSAGFTIYPDKMLATANGDVYLRDLHARDTLMLRTMPDRPLWLLTEAPEAGGPLRFARVDLDSARREWQAP